MVYKDEIEIADFLEEDGVPKEVIDGVIETVLISIPYMSYMTFSISREESGAICGISLNIEVLVSGNDHYHGMSSDDLIGFDSEKIEIVVSGVKIKDGVVFNTSLINLSGYLNND